MRAPAPLDHRRTIATLVKMRDELRYEVEMRSALLPGDARWRSVLAAARLRLRAIQMAISAVAERAP